MVGFENLVRVICEVWKDGWIGFEKIAGVIGGIWKDFWCYGWDLKRLLVLWVGFEKIAGIWKDG